MSEVLDQRPAARNGGAGPDPAPALRGALTSDTAGPRPRADYAPLRALGSVFLAAVAVLAGPPIAEAGDLLFLRTSSVPAPAGYGLEVQAVPFAGVGGTRLIDFQFVLTRVNYGITQAHAVEFNLPATSFTWAPDLSRARVSTGARLGRWGRVEMTFRKIGRPRNRLRSRGLCSGTYLEQAGLLEGLLTLKTGGPPFRTIRLRQTRATLGADGARPLCSPAEAQCLGPGGYLVPEADQMLFGGPIEPPGMLAAGFRTRAGAVAEVDFIDLPKARTPTFVHHRLRFTGPGAFVAESFDSAALTFAFNTWLGGTIGFRGGGVRTACGAFARSPGTVTASVTANFDWGGTRTFTGSIDGFLLASASAAAGTRGQ